MRQRSIYFTCAVVVMAAGLASRRYRAYLPDFLATYAGDTLWALMVYLGASVLLPRWSPAKRAVIASAFALGIETSQLYHAPWIDAIRQTTLGGLVLGFGFLWTDLVCYAVGIAVGAGIELAFRPTYSELDSAK